MGVVPSRGVDCVVVASRDRVFRQLTFSQYGDYSYLPVCTSPLSPGTSAGTQVMVMVMVLNSAYTGPLPRYL